MKEAPENLDQLMGPGWRALASMIVKSLKDQDQKEKPQDGGDTVSGK